jgi:carboxyl-terminal processing protease
VKGLLENRKILKNIFVVLVVISFMVTALVGVFFITNYQSIGKMLEVAAVIKTQYLEDVSVKQMMAGAVRGMVESLDDPYSVYMDKEEYEEFRQHIEGSIGGIGIYVSVKDDKFVVFSVIENTPASKGRIAKR